MIEFYCQDKKCLCHQLCLSGHFVLNPIKDTCLSSCSYYPIIKRHYHPKDGKKLDVFLCSERCNNCYSNGQVTIIYNDEKSKWIIYSDQNDNNKQDLAGSS